MLESYRGGGDVSIRGFSRVSRLLFLCILSFPLVGGTACDPRPVSPTGDLPAGLVEPRGANAYQEITGDDSEEDRGRWDALYGTKNYVFGTEPSAFLKAHVHLLPVGRALDIGMGEGRNAVFLARLGFEVEGLDISSMALAKARRLAEERGVRIKTIQADLAQYELADGAYDVVININFLARTLLPRIRKSVRPGGYIVYENPTVDQLLLTPGSGMRRDQLLEKGELPRLFPGWEVIRYEEKSAGKTAWAGLIARKPGLVQGNRNGGEKDESEGGGARKPTRGGCARFRAPVCKGVLATMGHRFQLFVMNSCHQNF